MSRSKSYLTNLVAFCDAVKTMVNKGTMSDNSCLVFCKAFSMVLYNNLVFRLETRGFEGWNVWGIRNWLGGYSQRVVISDSVSRWRPVTSGVP